MVSVHSCGHSVSATADVPRGFDVSEEHGSHEQQSATDEWPTGENHRRSETGRHVRDGSTDPGTPDVHLKEGNQPNQECSADVPPVSRLHVFLLWFER